MAIVIAYNMNHLQYAADNSGVLNGQNQIFGWNSHFKMNQNYYVKGTGIPTSANFNFIEDMDGIDTTINDQDTEWGASFQSV
ncbi:hypothetical protein [Lentibacillus sp. Marseille-P4043]|uniref:hypothetical protein n=1 Tax=Lentibacillus sp. Marseille-P4043 TaxID=2040293 RepID=UPI000D0AC72B|nr:hypothetical protein [Lentibacillus sp. Marseille-P4043]